MELPRSMICPARSGCLLSGSRRVVLYSPQGRLRIREKQKGHGVLSAVEEVAEAQADGRCLSAIRLAMPSQVDASSRPSASGRCAEV